jgi:uncharacterized protein (DUF488 family)
MQISEILTIGYERMTLTGFIKAVVAEQVAVLADIRAIAQSRRPGFAKTALRSALEDAGIAYLHLPRLGNPKAGRMAAWAGEFAEYERIFGEHVSTPTGIEALAALAHTARRSRVCLMCMEAAPEACHRSIVASKLREIGGFRVRHLRPACLDERRVA